MINILAPQAMPTTDAYTTEAVHGAKIGRAHV